MNNRPQETLNAMAAPELARKVDELVTAKKAGWVKDTAAFETVYGLQVYTDGQCRTALVVYTDAMDFEVDDRVDEILGL